MAESAWQFADDFKSQILPKAQRGSVGRDDKVELDGAKPEPPRFAQAMLAYVAADSFSARIQRDHECRVRDMRTGPALIDLQNIGADNMSILLGHVGVRAFAKPVGQRIFT